MSESQGIDEYVKKTHAIVRPTGIWLFPNGVMGASPDGLVYQHLHAADPIGIIEVKCPYSMRSVKLQSETQWHTYLNYLNCMNCLKQDHPYWHQIQGGMAAVDVQWCDFIIWTPNQILIKRINRDPDWASTYLLSLEMFYKGNLLRREDMQMDCPSVLNSPEEENYPPVPQEEPTRDLNTILHPVGGACQELRSFMIQALHFNIARIIYQLLSQSRSGMKWPEAVSKFWHVAVEKICETCLRSLFRNRWERFAKEHSRREVNDIVMAILPEDDYIWSSLLYDAEFAQIIRSRVKSFEPSYATTNPPCTCRAFPHNFGYYSCLQFHQSQISFPQSYHLIVFKDGNL